MKPKHTIIAVGQLKTMIKNIVKEALTNPTADYNEIAPDEPDVMRSHMMRNISKLVKSISYLTAYGDLDKLSELDQKLAELVATYGSGV